MFWMARTHGFILAGMPMDSGMLAGMALIVGGIAVLAICALPTRLYGATLRPLPAPG
jgi:putative MFS transporter